MKAKQHPPTETELTFFQNTKPNGLPVASIKHEDEDWLVILGDTYPQAKSVQPGETWRCRVWKKATCMLAEPIARTNPPHTPDEVPPSPQDPPPQPDDTTATVTMDAPAEDPALPYSELPRVRMNGHASREEPLVRFKDAPAIYDAEEYLLDTVERFRRDERVIILVHGPEADEIAEAIDGKIWWDLLHIALTGPAQAAGAIYHDSDWGDAERGTYHETLAKQQYTIRVPSRIPEAREEALQQLDTEFALDAYRTGIQRADTIFLFVHNAKWAPLVRALQERGKRIFLLTTRNLLAPSLLLAADKPVFYIEDLDGINVKWPVELS